MQDKMSWSPEMASVPEWVWVAHTIEPSPKPVSAAAAEISQEATLHIIRQKHM